MCFPYCDCYTAEQDPHKDNGIYAQRKVPEKAGWAQKDRIVIRDGTVITRFRAPGLLGFPSDRFLVGLTYEAHDP
jgi:hypothetical protein